LARHFGTEFVAEYGRELWIANGGTLTYEHMLDIAHRQVEREEAAASLADRYLFCDTSPLTTLFYSEEMFGRADPALRALAVRPYDGHILCAPDFEFVQDGTRRDATFRERQHAWYLSQFREERGPFVLAEGSVGDRVTRIAKWLLAGPGNGAGRSLL
jgi:nicotinamide riboside kinase